LDRRLGGPQSRFGRGGEDRNNIKGYYGKTLWTDSQNSDTTAYSDRQPLPFAVLAPGGQSGKLLDTPSYMRVLPDLYKVKLRLSFDYFNTCGI
jgi:hypothetical protein